MRRIVGVLAFLVAGGCGGSSNPSIPDPAATRATEEPPASVSPTSPAPLVGTWQRVTTCQEFVRAQAQAGFEEFILEGVAGNGWLPGVTSVEQIADPNRPCEGAVPREHAHFFTEYGEFGSLDWNEQRVDDGAYTIIDDRTFVIGKTMFHFDIIGGDRIMFDPVIPDCSTDPAWESERRCRGAASWSVAVAYTGTTWERVD